MAQCPCHSEPDQDQGGIGGFFWFSGASWTHTQGTRALLAYTSVCVCAVCAAAVMPDIVGISDVSVPCFQGDQMVACAGRDCSTCQCFPAKGAMVHLQHQPIRAQPGHDSVYPETGRLQSFATKVPTGLKGEAVLTRWCIRLC